MVARQVSKTEFKAKLTEYIHQIQSSGVKVIVTDHGIPVLEVRSFCGDVRQPLDVLRGTVVRYENPLCPVGDGDW
jgi:antitoxin (DNA-binding transcriptional repressor) of toxin-antitoxin stability system